MKSLFGNRRLRELSARASLVGNPTVKREVKKILINGKHPLHPKHGRNEGMLKKIPRLLLATWLILPMAVEEFLTKTKKRKADSKINSEVKKVLLDDVIGIDEYKFEVEQVVDFFKNSSKYKDIGADVTKGVLLYGKPGVGKTMLAKALANESSFNFMYASGSEFADKFFGGTAKKVKEVFEEAEKKKPCVIFIDEIDSIGSKRSNEPSLQVGSNDGLNQLLHEMDGFNKHENIIVIGATNRFESLDPALLRPGRFDTLINIPNLNMQGRIKLFDHYLTKINMEAQGLDKDKFVDTTQGFTGADIKNAFNLAAISAGYTNKLKVDNKDLEQAVDRIINGNQLDGNSYTQEQTSRQAYSEAAMAIVAKEIGEFERINSLNISNSVSKSENLGLKGKEAPQIFTKTSLWNNLQLFVSCRAAEELLYGKSEISFNCSERMKKARVMAKLYTENISKETDGSLELIMTDKSKSNDMLHRQESQVTTIIKNCLTGVTSILASKIDQLHKLASELIQKKSVSKEAVRLYLN